MEIKREICDNCQREKEERNNKNSEWLKIVLITENDYIPQKLDFCSFDCAAKYFQSVAK